MLRILSETKMSLWPRLVSTFLISWTTPESSEFIFKAFESKIMGLFNESFSDLTDLHQFPQMDMRVTIQQFPCLIHELHYLSWQLSSIMAFSPESFPLHLLSHIQDFHSYLGYRYRRCRSRIHHLTLSLVSFTIEWIFSSSWKLVRVKFDKYSILMVLAPFFEKDLEEFEWDSFGSSTISLQFAIMGLLLCKLPNLTSEVPDSLQIKYRRPLWSLGGRHIIARRSRIAAPLEDGPFCINSRLRLIIGVLFSRRPDWPEKQRQKCTRSVPN